MKQLKNIYSGICRIISDPWALTIWILFGLMVPNVALCFTEPMTSAGMVATIFLPLGIYSLMIALVKRPGIAAFILLPFMIFAAFQLVLLHLYGEGLIAVDMFLNVFTTSFSEATELLENLVTAILEVILLYVTALVWGVVVWRGKVSFNKRSQRNFIIFSSVSIIVGLTAVAIGYKTDEKFSAVRAVFPINVIDNLCEAVNRTRQMAHYEETSANFTYNAKSVHPDSIGRELYIIVVGETGRAANWQLGGYERHTNPRLSYCDGLTYFSKSFSESNTTHKSVPMMLSVATAEKFDSIYNYKSIITAFKEAGYHTAFFSVQTPNRSYTQFFANEADTTVYIPSDELSMARDGELLPLLDKEIAINRPRQLIVLHTYGSHFKYSDRYPEDFKYFQPDHCMDASKKNRQKLINAYDNTILYTDHILSEIIRMADDANCRAAVLYSTDHGEDIFDDSRDKFLHASPTPTAMQLHVPTLCWLSEECLSQSPDYSTNIHRNATQVISPQRNLSMTAFDIAGIKTPYFNPKWSLVSEEFTSDSPIYVTDRNEAVSWDEIHFRKPDNEYLNKVLGLESIARMK